MEATPYSLLWWQYQQKIFVANIFIIIIFLFLESSVVSLSTLKDIQIFLGFSFCQFHKLKGLFLELVITELFCENQIHSFKFQRHVLKLTVQTFFILAPGYQEDDNFFVHPIRFERGIEQVAGSVLTFEGILNVTFRKVKIVYMQRSNFSYKVVGNIISKTEA